MCGHVLGHGPAVPQLERSIWPRPVSPVESVPPRPERDQGNVALGKTRPSFPPCYLSTGCGGQDVGLGERPPRAPVVMARGQAVWKGVSSSSPGPALTWGGMNA